MEVLAGMPGHMAQYRKADQKPPLMFQQPMIFTEGVSLISYFNSNQTGEPEQVQKGNKIAPAPRSRPMSGALLQKSAFHKLEDQQGVIIKQKMDMMELLSGCETQNTYFIYPLGKETMTKEHLLFKCQERSGFCARNCLPGSARSFQMTISTYKRGGEDQGSDYQPFLSLERPCQCTCFCCDRPEISVTLIEDGKNEYLGKIVDPFAFCNLKADVYDEDNDRIYNIEAQCCQPGVMCSLPCEACQKVDFEVKSQYGDVVSTVQKVSGGSCIKASCSDVDNFAVNFPVGASTRKKVLLMCAALLIDYSNFERKSGNNENHI